MLSRKLKNAQYLLCDGVDSFDTRLEVQKLWESSRGYNYQENLFEEIKRALLPWPRAKRIFLDRGYLKVYKEVVYTKAFVSDKASSQLSRRVSSLKRFPAVS